MTAAAPIIFDRMLVPDDLLIDGRRIAYGEHALPKASKGAHVVLVHGTPSSSIIWRNVAPVLIEAGYHVISYDLLGYGASERPHNPSVDTSVSGQVPVLLGLLDRLGAETVHLLAHDIGGAIAQRAGILHPERVSSLALLDVCSFDSWPSERTRQQMKSGFDALIRAPADEHENHFKEWLLSTVVDEAAMRAGPLGSYLDFISGPVGQSSFFQHQVAHYDHRHTSDISERLGELGRVPVSIIWGAEDQWQKPHWAERLHTAIPGSSLTFIEAAGHFVMEDKPVEVSQALLEHLSKAVR
ncbi:alpha/beta hydrolase [uncultured Marivita sp.]|uniref:alpha/beta fold hydrolase n=1 Tax=uncultured Marivita sp. TaxID=888080 RepID=UPI0026349E2D|nr:alpha/beta hydrolase [uncultured Marivita sp.]